MITYWPTVHFGTLAAESILVVCIVPKQAKGIIVRGMDVFLATEQAPGPTDYWVVELGTIAGQMEFFPKAQHATPFKGMAKGRNEVAFPAPVPYATGEVVALRAIPVGSPASLTDLQVVVRIEEP